MVNSPHIASVGTAVPSYAVDQAYACAFLEKHYGSTLKPRSIALMRKLFAHPSITRRYFALEHPDALVSETPDERISRFTRSSIELSAQAITAALAQVNLPLSAVEGVVVNTCTGYICPGISTYLIEELNLPRTLKVYDLVGSGCGGALPNLEVAASLLNPQSEGVIVSVSVEVCSATFQVGDELSLLVSNTLFGDGAAAAVLWNRPEGLQLIDSTRIYVPEQREAIRYIHKNGQLHNQLSTLLPQYVKKAVAQVIGRLLPPYGLSIPDIAHWALHTGGEKIVNEIQEELHLPEDKLIPTRTILSNYGNMSSPTVWFVLDEIVKGKVKAGAWMLMLAFGAGLSAHGYLLRNTCPDSRDT